MNKKIYLSLGVILITLLHYSYAQAQEVFFDLTIRQNKVTGQVTDESGQAIRHALVTIQGTNFQTFTDSTGFFETKNLNEGHYVFDIQYPNHTSFQRLIAVNRNTPVDVQVELQSDGLQWKNTVQTGRFKTTEKERITNSVYATTASQINVLETLTTSSSGYFAQQTTLHGRNSGIARGILNSVNTTGFQPTIIEDGLPITTTNFLQHSANLFLNNDLSNATIELLNTGNAATYAPLATGSIIQLLDNNITNQTKRTFRLTSYFNENDNAYYRWDLGMQGAIQPNLKYSINGFVKGDQGIRNTPFTTMNYGGQLKGKLIYEHQKGYIQLGTKVLKDRIEPIQSTPVSQFNASGIVPFRDFEAVSNSLTPNLQARITDGENWSEDNVNTTRIINTENQTQVNHYNTALSIGQLLGKGFWLENQSKYSTFLIDATYLNNPTLWNTTSGAAEFLKLPRLNAIGQISPFYEGNFNYNVADAFYTRDDNLLNNQPLGRHFLLQEVNHSKYDTKELMNQLTLKKEFKNHEIAIGGFYAKSTVTMENTGDHLATTLSANPSPLLITHHNPLVGLHPFVSASDTVLSFTDNNGFLGHGTGDYLRFNADVKTTSFFGNYTGKITDKLNIDIGWRYNKVQHKGEKEQFFAADDRFYGTGVGPINLATGQLHIDPVSKTTLGYANGADLNYQTFYDASTKIGSGEWDEFDFTYQYHAYNLGLQYQITKNIGVHSNYSATQRTPDLGYYTQHFTNIEVEAGQKEYITSAEFGTKLQGKQFALGITGFYTKMDSINVQKSMLGQFYRSVLIPDFDNSIETYGVELEGFIKVNLNMDIRFNATFQNPIFTQLTYYNNAGTPEKLGDDFTEDFSGNMATNLPKFWAAITPTYRHKWITVFATASYIGERQANLRNSVQLPNYTQLNTGIQASYKNIIMGLEVFNLTNTQGVVRYTDTGVTNQTIDEVAYGGVTSTDGSTLPNTDLNELEADSQPFFVQTILPRQFRLTLQYQF